MLGTRIEYFAPNGIVHSWRRGFSHVRVAGYTYVGWPTQLPNGEKYYHSILFQMAPLAFFTGDEWDRKDFGPAIGSAISREIAGKSVISYAASDIFGLAKTQTAPFALDGCTVPRPMIQAKAFTRPTPEQILRAQGAGIETTLVALCP